MWSQTYLTLSPKPRGFHLITSEVLSQVDLTPVKIGLFHLFIQHTSASLTLNENASPDVRSDFEAYVRRSVPDENDYFQHIFEGPDDMSAHIKASLFGFNVSVPIVEGRLQLGTWQGIYLGEHRERGGQRRLLATVQGEGYGGG